MLIAKLGDDSDLFIFNEEAKLVASHFGWVEGPGSGRILSINGKMQGEVTLNIINNWTVLEN